MDSSHSSDGSPERVLSQSAELTRAKTAESAINGAIELATTAFDQPVVSVCRYDPATETVSTLNSSFPSSMRADSAPSHIPEPVAKQCRDWTDKPVDKMPEASVDTDLSGPLQIEAVVPAGRNRVLRVGLTNADDFEKPAVSAVEGIAANLETALHRIDRHQPNAPQAERSGAPDADALRRLNELIVDAGEFDEAIERLLSLGCDHFGLETGILSQIEGDDYEIEAVVDPTGAYETGDVYDLADTMCHVTVADGVTEPLAFADVKKTTYEDTPAAADIRAYIAAPVVVNGMTYGTVNFSMSSARPTPFRPEDREFVRLVAQWLGTEITRRRQFEELERYETILEAVGDPVYALNPAGEFTFINTAAKREFGYGDEVIGKQPSVGMASADVKRIREQIEELLATGGQSVTAEFELETADGGRKIVENRLALIGDDEFRGSAGVLRDITAREEQRQQLESFQRAVEEAADGIAILDGNEYIYVDQSHVDMYGFDTTEQLLGKTWRELYTDEEAERLEQEAFETLKSEGYWKGRVTGSRPDGSTFPAELSLSIIDDGRLVCTVRDETERRARERELELKEQAMNEAEVGIQITGPSAEGNRLVYVNDGFERLTGYTREEALGRNPRFLQGADTDPEKRSRLREAIKSEEPISLELQNSRKDGTPYWSRLSITPVADESGAVQNYIGIQQDVTERKAREAALADSQERYQTLLQAAPDPVFVADAETGEIVETNAAAEELAGRPRAELIGLDQTRLHPQADSELYREAFESSIGSEDIITELANGDQPKLRDADGNTFPVEINADTVQLPDGPVMYGVFRDISKRKQRDNELKLKERAMDEANVGITISDPSREDNPLIYVNDGFVEQTGYDRSAAVGRNCRFLQADDRDQQALDDLRDAIATDESITVDLRNYRQNGEQFWNRLSVTPVYDDDGQLTNHIGIQQDVTEEKTREQRLRALLRVTKELLQAVSTEEAANRTLETVATEFGFDQSAFYRRDDDELMRIASRGTSTATPPDRVERGQTPLWEAAESGEPVQYNDYGALDDGVDRGDVTASAYVPVGDHGVIVVGATDSDHLGDSERQLIEVLAGNLAAVLDSLDREESIRASEQRYRSLAENIPNGAVLTFDAELNYRLAAGELLSGVGLEPSDISGAAVGAVLPDTDAGEKLLPRFRAALDGERTDTRVALRDRTIRIHIVPVDPADNEPTGTRGLLLAQDVTEEARREQELFEERERFRLLTESVDEYAFVVVDEDGVIQTWNESAETMFGYDAEAAVGMPMAKLHPEADRESDLSGRLLQQARVAGESAHEGWRVRADGTEFYADARYAPLDPDDGEFRGFAKIVRDMTDRRRQQRRTEQFVEQSDDVVTIVDPDGTITYASGSADRVLGYDPDDLVGENLFDYLHPEGREDAMETFFAGMEDPDADFQAECRLESGDGEWLNVEGQCRNRLDDAAIDGMLLYLRDVTESKERARRFESIFNQTFQFTGLLDPDGTVVEANDAALDFGGIERETIVGRPFYEAPWWTHSDEVYEEVRNAIDRAASGEFVRYETEVRGGDGLATIDFSVKPVTDDDGTVTLLVVEGRDISRQQQQRQHMEVLQRVMRHNMRNDLTKMRGWTRVMCDENDADKRAEQFETVKRILDRWDGMTEKMKQIRQLSQSHGGDQPKMDAAQLIEDAVAPTRDESADATITTRISDGASIQVPTALLEAVRELVDNAADATDAGQITVGVDPVEGGWTEICVNDDGPGLPEMEANLLETGEETPLNHGGGLGLWMVRTVVTQAGGEVSVTSTDDGTEVCLRVPTAEQSKPPEPV